MNQRIEAYLEKYPNETAAMYRQVRQLIYESTESEPLETMWAGMPTYSAGERFVRLILFRDHLNIEAKAAVAHREELKGYKFTPKGMLQIYLNQEIPADVLKRIFEKTLG